MLIGVIYCVIRKMDIQMQYFFQLLEYSEEKVYVIEKFEFFELFDQKCEEDFWSLRYDLQGLVKVGILEVIYSVVIKVIFEF